MTYLTEEEAAATACPIARTFDEGKEATCDGSKCILWRWKVIAANDPLFVSAVQREMACLAQDDGKGKAAVSFHKQAVANVGKDPEGHGVKAIEGYCGLGGKP